MSTVQYQAFDTKDIYIGTAETRHQNSSQARVQTPGYIPTDPVGFFWVDPPKKAAKKTHLN